MAKQEFIACLKISIHAPLRERRASALSANYNLGISIHAPLRERLIVIVLLLKRKFYFNPRSLTGATLGFVTINGAKYISIHAPLRERPCSPR